MYSAAFFPYVKTRDSM